ncbi:MAG: hypothetical protein ACFFAS_10660 [Promethearchaeota archaeon]
MQSNYRRKKRNSNKLKKKAIILVVFIIFTSINFNGIFIARLFFGKFDNINESNPELGTDLIKINEEQSSFADWDFCYHITDGITRLESVDLELFSIALVLTSLICLFQFGVVISNKIDKWRKKSIDFPPEGLYGLEEQDILIYETVQSYLNKNRCFNTDKVLPFVKSTCARLGVDLNQNGIKRTLKTFVEGNIFVEGSKLTKDTILKNTNRTRIFNHIRDNPGVHFTQIARSLKMNNYLLRWHLDALVKFNCIRSEKIGNLEAFFDIEIEQEQGRILQLISRKKVKLILDYLQNSNDKNITKYRISKVLKMHPNTISKYITLLEEARIVRLEKRKNTYYVSLMLLPDYNNNI